MTRPSVEEILMLNAENWARRGTCSRQQIGAVAAYDGRILATGYNGAPAGLPHCKHNPDDPPCTYAVHAEANLVAFAARRGVSLDGATLVSTMMPCYICAQQVINAGIIRVIAKPHYRGVHEGATLMRDAGVAVVEWSIRSESSPGQLDGGSGCATKLARREAAGLSGRHRDIWPEASSRSDSSLPDR